MKANTRRCIMGEFKEEAFWKKLPIQICVLIFTCLLLCGQSSSNSIQLVSNNINDILRNNEITFVNFYADWCRFSQMLAPIFDDAAKKVKAEFPEDGRVVFGKVDCDRETGIASQYHVSKYPTLKIFRNGNLVKREYRGQRSTDAIVQFVKDQLRNSIQNVENIDDLDNIDRKKRHIIGYFESTEYPSYQIYRRLSSQLRDDCIFHSAIGAVSEKERIAGEKIVFRPPGEGISDMPFVGTINDFNILLTWAQDKCVPLVREITFENAEELTEEGLPFMILFHHPDDTTTPDTFRNMVSKELLGEKSSVNFLTADGLKFSHPLYHLGKTSNDLPVLAIDSFRHMYLWKHNPKEDLQKPGLLKAFIADLHSGKLHREFHHGPEATQAPTQANGDGAVAVNKGKHEPHVGVQQQVVVHSNGQVVQVVKLVQVGERGQINLKEQLEAMQKDAKVIEAGKEEESKNENKKAEAQNDDPKKENEEKETTVKPGRLGDQVEVQEEKTKKETIQKPEVNKLKEKEVEDKTEKTASFVPDIKINKTHIEVVAEKLRQESQVNNSVESSTVVHSTYAKLKVTTEKPVETTSKAPPESIFKFLAPSEKRYSFKDEL